ncbi:MAG: nucleotidyltransferase domain-containing protein [bacterium]
MSNLDLNKKYLDILTEIINSSLPEESVAFIFGSRVDGTSKPTSDIDIGVKGIKDQKYLKLFLLKEKLNKAIIPYFMDVVDFDNENDTNFGKFAMQNVYYIKNGQNNS